MFDDLYDNDRAVAVFAINFAKRLEDEVAALAAEQIYTDGETSVIVPWGYDSDSDPDGMLAGFESCRNPDGKFSPDPNISEFAKKVLKETGILERREELIDRDITRMARGLACGILRIDTAIYPYRIDGEMLEFARSATGGLEIWHNDDTGEWGAKFSVRQGEAPRKTMRF